MSDPYLLELFLGLLPLYLMFLPLALGTGYLAPKMGANTVLWIIIFLIPIVNVFAIYIFGYRIFGAILDKLNALSGERRKL